MNILGIETSCDETAAAVVKDGSEMLSNAVSSSVDLHAEYGGVVPEIAARSHIEVILPVVHQALAGAFPGLPREKAWAKIDAIAVTYGPGLGGSLLIGVLTARTLAIAKDKPLYAVNHVAAHPYANFITKTGLAGYKLPAKVPEFPFLALIVSGGHSQLVFYRGHFDYEVIGRTADDAVGEAFDKVAKMLGLPYPGGPSVSQAAAQGDPNAFPLPLAKMDNPYDFSFSGLKTAVLRAAQQAIGKDYAFPSKKLPQALSEAQKHNIAASFQRAAIDALLRAARKAIDKYQPASLVVAGGVAANQALRQELNNLPIEVLYTDIKLCTDNGAMVAALGYYLASHKQPAADPYTLSPAPNLQM